MPRTATRCSAYISVFDDWDLLPAALARIGPVVDEIVVVDGAYRWMAPVLQSTGRDPARSDPRVLDALAPWAAKIRLIEDVWTGELAKRIAGYEACRYDRIWRVDADEVLFIDDHALERHLSGGWAVGLMDMPLYVAPGLVRAVDGPERQAVLFDRSQIAAQDHLSYLWLVLSADEQARLAPADPARIAPDAVAFNAHLTHWRGPETAARRTRFYVLNWLRDPGRHVHWDPAFRYTAEAGFAPLIERLGNGRLDELMLCHANTAAPPGFAALAPTKLTRAEEAGFAPCYGQMLRGLAAMNAELAERPRAVAWGEMCWFDLSTPAACAPFGGDTGFTLRYDQPVRVAEVQLRCILSNPPWQTDQVLTAILDGTQLHVDLPPAGAELRRCLAVTAWGSSGNFTRIIARE